MTSSAPQNWHDIDSYVSRDLNEKKGGNWLITFADLLSLMLTFFVLLYSMSTVQTGEWERMRDSLQQRLNPEREVKEIAFVEIRSVPKITQKKGIDLDYVFGITQEKLKDKGLSNVKVHHLDDRIIISLASDVLFRPASATPSDIGISTLSKVSDIISSLSNKVEVNGHTDPSPISSQLYHSNWELSLARSLTVAEHIMAAGYPNSIDAFGMASTRYDSISKKLPTKTRNALSRRVDIIIRETVAE